MKRFLTLILSFICLSASAQEFNPRAFRTDIEYMTPRTYPSRQVSFGYSVELRNDSAIVYLPYMGNVYVPDLNNEGINFAHPYKNFSVKQNKKKTATTVKFSFRHSFIEYRFTVIAYLGGRVDIYMQPSNAQSCSYSGTWENTE